MEFHFGLMLSETGLQCYLQYDFAKSPASLPFYTATNFPLLNTTTDFVLVICYRFIVGKVHYTLGKSAQKNCRYRDSLDYPEQLLQVSYELSIWLVSAVISIWLTSRQLML